ncbi:MAG: J domain-containing protein [Chloroflexia bacterium]|nr:J domain-containing protein [Chloroflexia bacterium]
MLKYHLENMFPLGPELANRRLELAMVLGNCTTKYKFGKRQSENIKMTILDLCDKAFSVIEPTKEQEEFYNQWAETTYKEELAAQEKEAKEEFAGFMDFMFGVEIDPEKFEGTEQDMEDLYKKMQEHFNENEPYTKQRKKTKKQIEREERQKAEEAIEKKSIRSIYIALAKVLHPDTEPDPVQKLEKEELMKKVTKAFEEKDLPTLLHLEMEWVHKESNHLEQLTDEKLSVYISALKQQVKELEQQRWAIKHNPRYSAIVHLLQHISGKNAMFALKVETAEEKSRVETFDSFITKFKKEGQKKNILEFIEEYSDLIYDQETMMEFDDLFFD